ncbi:MAG: DUF2780 domain-containing protein [Pseudomonadota bacterium]
MVDELIGQITGQLGIDAGTAEKGVGSILAAVQSQASDADASDLMSKLPGAEALIEKVTSAQGGGGGGGLVGGLMSKAAGMLGQSGGGDLMGMLSQFSGSGVSLDEIKSMAPTVLGFAREKAGDDLVNKILGQIPALKSLL